MNLTKRLSWLLVILLLAACTQQPEPPEPYQCYDTPDSPSQRTLTATTKPSSLPYVPGQLLVRYKMPITSQSLKAQRASYKLTAQAVSADYGLTTLESGSSYTADLVTIAPEQDLQAVMVRLNADPRVKYAEPNYYLVPLSIPIPNDELIDEQWNMLDFGLPAAWDIETGSSNVTIAIIDSGVTTDHEDLKAKMLPGCDLHDGDSNPNPGSSATAEHGTHVAGIAAATGDNGIGVAGVAYTGVHILPVKVFDDTGEFATANDLVKGIRWAVGLPVEGVNDNPNPAQILNISLGTQGSINSITAAVQTASARGALVVAASGNNGSSNELLTPANVPEAVAVGSVDQDYQRSNFSNYNTSGLSVDIMAPGGFGSSSCGAVYSTLPNPKNYGCLAGTSMAAPFVSGVAALLWSQTPGLSAEQVENILIDSSNTYFESDWNESEYGAGVICADAVLGADTLCGH